MDATRYVYLGTRAQPLPRIALTLNSPTIILISQYNSQPANEFIVSFFLVMASAISVSEWTEAILELDAAKKPLEAG